MRKSAILDPEHVRLINKYIYRNLDINSDNYIKELYKLIKYMEVSRYEVNPYLIVDLIKENETLYFILDKIFSKYRDAFIDGGIDKIIDNDLIISFVYCYMDINNISYLSYVVADDILSSINLYYNDIRNFPLLTFDEEKELGYLARNGNIEARDKLITSNLKLVVLIAKKYVRYYGSLQDLIQEGNIGLAEAAVRYDPDKGVKFSVYANYWIKREIRNYVFNNSNVTGVPNFFRSKMRAYDKLSLEYLMKYNRMPTLKEFMEVLDLKEEEVKIIESFTGDTVSINFIVGKNEEYGDGIPDTCMLPEDKVIRDEMTNEIEKLIASSNLKPREVTVLTKRFGLNGERVKTLRDIGKELGVTRQCVEQIQVSAINKLRKSPVISNYAVYMDKPDDAVKFIYDTLRKDKRNYELTPVKNNFVKTIYELLSDYTKEEINDEISKLPVRYREIIYRRYGNDLENPIRAKISKQEYNLFYNSILKTLRTNLKDRKMNEILLTPDDMNVIVNYFMNTEYFDLLSFLSFKEAIIFLLVNGLYNNYQVSFESIGHLFNLDRAIVRDIYLDILKKYKNNITINELLAKKLVKEK